MRMSLLFSVALGFLLLSGCPVTETGPYETETDTDTDTDTDSDTDTDTDTDMDTDTDTDTDTPRNLCGTGCAGTCEALPAPDGNLYCVTPYTPPTESCTGTPMLGECCENSDCTDGGSCVSFQHQYCGGAAPPEENVCYTPECVRNSDCEDGEACIPQGAFQATVAQCVPAACHSDSDCSAGPGGQCEALSTGSCGLTGGFYCTYDHDPCRSDSDCPSMANPELCLPKTGGGTECVEQFPMP